MAHDREERLRYIKALEESVNRKIEELKEMQPIVMCCAAGIRSGQAVEFLKSNGFVEL